MTIAGLLHRDRRPRQPSSAWLIWHQLRYDCVVLSRNRQARLLSVVLPVVMLVLLVSIFGHQKASVDGHRLSESTYYVAGMTVFGLVNVAFIALAVNLVTQREATILKRRLVTPEPLPVLIVGRALAALVLALLLAVVIALIGAVAYGVRLPGSAIGVGLLTAAVGTISFCCLAFGVSGLIASADSAFPLVTLLTLPLYVISGVFVPEALVPAWLHDIAAVFPVRPLTAALVASYSPFAANWGLRPLDLAVLVAWGAAGVALAAWRFSWTPRAG